MREEEVGCSCPLPGDSPYDCANYEARIYDSDLESECECECYQNWPQSGNVEDETDG